MISISQESEPRFIVLFETVVRKISSCGLSSEEFNNLKSNPIGHRKFEDFVKINISLGNYEWKKGKLYNTRKHNFLDLDDKHLKILRLRSMKVGVSEAEFASKLISDLLDK